MPHFGFGFLFAYSLASPKLVFGAIRIVVVDKTFSNSPA
jgi:hypothetical protein